MHKKNKKIILNAILFALMFILVVYVPIIVLKEQAKQDLWCQNKYGKDNYTWDFNETKGLAAVYVCNPKQKK